MVQLDATLRDLDTVGTWPRDYSDALAAMGGNGVALGTDFNGLSPQMPFAASPVPYPMPKPHGAPASMPTLGPARLGGKTHAFDPDGIAHYGELAVIGQPLADHC